MENKGSTKGNWKQRLRHELFEYWLTAVYLMLYFGAFISYRRLLMAEYHIHYAHYGFAIIEALILAKIILIGDMLGLNRVRGNRPLIYATLQRSIRFTIWVALFEALEHLIEGLVRGEGLTGGVQELLRNGKYELLGYSLIVFFTFIPFFAFRELDQVLGEGMIWNLFFRRHEARRASGAGPGTKPGTPPGALPGTSEYEV